MKTECGCADECLHKPDCVFERKEDALVSEQGKPVAWRWKPKSATIWIYDPESQWLDEHRQDGIDIEPLYGSDEIASLRAQLASARKALEGVYDHMDRNGMASWPVAKRVRKELDSLTDEEGKQ